MKCTIRHHPACNENNIIVDDMWEDTMLDNGQRFQLSCTYGICIFVFVKLSLNWIILVAFNYVLLSIYVDYFKTNTGNAERN